MNKKGQVTIFIIIGIIIVGAVIGFFAFKDKLITKQIPASIEPVYNSFLSCLEETSKEGIYYVAAHGGYYNVPFESSIIYFTEEIPYYYLESKDYTPTIDSIETELENYISENLNACFDLDAFKKQGFEINLNNYSISVNINDGNVIIKMLNTLTISKGGDTSQFDDVEINFGYNLKKLHAVSKEIVESYAEKPGAICLTCLDELSNKNNVNIKVTPVTDVSVFENDIIWFFIEDKNDISENKLAWVFIVEQ